MNVKRTAVLTGITGHDTEEHIKERCNLYGLNCISVQLCFNLGTGRSTGYAKVIFMNTKAGDDKKLSILRKIDQWDVTESKIVENGLVYGSRRNAVHLNPIQFIREIQKLDLPNNPKFTQALTQGNVSFSTTSMSRNATRDIEEDDEKPKLKAPKSKKKKTVNEEEEEEEKEQEDKKSKKEKKEKKEKRKDKPTKTIKKKK